MPLTRIGYVLVLVSCVRVVALGRLFGNQGFGGQHQGRDRCRVAQRRTGDLDRVDDTGVDQVLVLAAQGVEALVGAGDSETLEITT